MRYLLLLLLVPTLALTQTAYTIESLPNPKDLSLSNYVSDPDGILTDAEVQQLNGLITDLERQTTVQVGVAIVNSIGYEVPKDFATDLFRLWGIGHKDNNNGLLVLMVIDQRRMEFETGYGLEPVLTDGICKRIQLDKMVPLAKEEKYGAALIAGMEEVVAILLNPAYRDELYADVDVNGNRAFWRNPLPIGGALVFAIPYLLSLFASWRTDKKALKKAPAYVKQFYDIPKANMRRLFLGIGAPAAIMASQASTGVLRTGEFILIAYGLLLVLTLEKRFRLNGWVSSYTQGKEAYDLHQTMQKSHQQGWGMAMVLFPMPFILYWMWYKWNQRKLRHTAPLNAVGVPLTRLKEDEDDAFLKGYEQTEEKIKSVDYDVWLDTYTGEKKIYRYDLGRTRYSVCKNCGGKTRHHTATKTLQAATYSSSGTGERTFTCKHCAHQDRVTFTIPKKTQSSSSGSGGGFGGGGGGGFGGGSSGGGGAGSSW